MTGNAECLLIGIVIGTAFRYGQDVVHFEERFRVRFVAFVAGEVISLQNSESVFCSASSLVDACFVHYRILRTKRRYLHSWIDWFQHAVLPT